MFNYNFEFLFATVQLWKKKIILFLSTKNYYGKPIYNNIFNRPDSLSSIFFFMLSILWKTVINLSVNHPYYMYNSYIRITHIHITFISVSL